MDKELEERLAAYRTEMRDLWLKMDWRFVAAIMSIVLMIPPVKMMYPERPTQSSVEHDRLLNEIGRRLSARQR